MLMTKKLKALSNLYRNVFQRRDRGCLSWSLRSLLIVLFVVQVVTIAGLVGYLSFRNGQDAINDMATKLQNEVNQRIDYHLDRYFSDARQLNELNVAAVNSGLLDPEDLDSMGRFFWKQAKLYQVGYILFGAKSGEYVDVGRPQTYPIELITERIEPKRYQDQRLYIYRH
jgi:hypothetical protein